MIAWGRRRRLLVDKLQLKLIGINISYLCTIIFIFLVAVFSPVMLELFSKTSAEQSAAAASEFLGLHKRVWPAVPVALGLMSLHALLVSHRIAGPLYRFRKVFGRIEQGDLTQRASIRKRDYLHREAQTINRMIDGLAANMTGIWRSSKQAREACRELQDVLGAAHPAIERALDRLESRLGTVEDRVARFTLPDRGSGMATANSEGKREVPAASSAG